MIVCNKKGMSPLAIIIILGALAYLFLFSAGFLVYATEGDNQKMMIFTGVGAFFLVILIYLVWKKKLLG